jgi:hypothetical protein
MTFIGADCPALCQCCRDRRSSDLLEHYGLEGMAMPYTMQDFEREVDEKILRLSAAFLAS